MTRVFYASTLFGAMSLAAALDAGLFGERTERRLLIVSQNVPIPEIAPGLETTPAFATIRERFDDIVRWNDVIAPMHPSQWVLPPDEEPMLSRLFVEHLGLADGVTELVLESVAVAPARTIGSLIRDCPVTVYSDGLMSYGPTRDALPAAIGRRVGRLLHLDLVPDLTPLLLREYDVETVPLDDAAFGAIVAGLPAPTVADGALGAPVVLGQYLSPLGILTADEELDMHRDMVGALAARGAATVVFRPHPAAGDSHVIPLRRHADGLGVELIVPTDNLPAEAWFGAARPELVVSCFSTALLTAARQYGCAVATMNTELALERIAPYENSNRIPATIVDATLPRLSTDGSTTAPPPLDVDHLVRAVGFCMQSNRLPDLRADAAAYLAQHGRGRYFKKRRLDAVGLGNGPAPATGSPATGTSATSATARQLARAGRRALRSAAEARRSRNG